MKPFLCLAADGLAGRVFGLELPCSLRVDRPQRRGHGVRCSLHDCQLQLGGLLGRAARRGLPVRVPAGLATSSVIPSCGVWSAPCCAPGFPTSACCSCWLRIRWLAWFGVLPMRGVRQLSRGCVVDDLACPDPGDGLGASRWSRRVVKERRFGCLGNAMSGICTSAIALSMHWCIDLFGFLLLSPFTFQPEWVMLQPRLDGYTVRSDSG